MTISLDSNIDPMTPVCKRFFGEPPVITVECIRGAWCGGASAVCGVVVYPGSAWSCQKAEGTRCLMRYMHLSKAAYNVR